MSSQRLSCGKQPEHVQEGTNKEFSSSLERLVIDRRGPWLWDHHYTSLKCAQGRRLSSNYHMGICASSNPEQPAVDVKPSKPPPAPVANQPVQKAAPTMAKTTIYIVFYTT